MRIVSVGQVVFATVLVAFGVIGLVQGDFTAPWVPVAEDLPGRALLVYVCAAILVATGAGLLLRRGASAAAGVLLASLLLWTLVFRVREIVKAPGEFGSWDGCAELLVSVAAAWALYAQLAARPRFATGATGVRIARTLYGLAMIPFGLAHYIYPNETITLIPDYVPAHWAVAYLTGTAFLAAGVAIVTGVWARLAAALSVVQIGLFTILVWIPRLIEGSLSEFQRTEFAVSIALTAAGWVVADSYRSVRARG